MQKYIVSGKQQSSRMCLVCGLKNPFGLRADFYEIQSGELIAVFMPRAEHQSYPGRLHGGITSAILDETMGRAIMMNKEEMVWGVTVDLNIRFKKQIPLDQPLRVIGRITKDKGRFFEGAGELLLSDGEVAATGQGRYLKLPLEKIADFEFSELEWHVVPRQDDPEEFVL